MLPRASRSRRTPAVPGRTFDVAMAVAIARRHPDIGTAIVHLGATTVPGGFIVTMTGSDGVQLLQRLHYDDYGVFKSRLRRKESFGAPVMHFS